MLRETMGRLSTGNVSSLSNDIVTDPTRGNAPHAGAVRLRSFSISRRSYTPGQRLHLRDARIKPVASRREPHAACSGTLNESQVRQVEAHLLECADCRGEMADQSLLRQHMRSDEGVLHAPHASLHESARANRPHPGR